MQTVFEAAGGNDGLCRLADAWHRRVMADDVVAHAFSHGFHPQHVERLAAYWAEALGGPTTYSDFYGDETTVVKMHSGNGEAGTSTISIRPSKQNSAMCARTGFTVTSSSAKLSGYL
jgi:truncated hemoglobin YjbI